MKKTFLSAVKAMCAGVMTLCMASLTFVSCYDDSDLQNKYKDLNNRLTVVEQLAAALEERADDALYTLEFQVGGNELQYSFDGGNTWQSTGVVATEGLTVVDVEDDEDTITFFFNDNTSFTIEKPIEVQFEIRSGKVLFASCETKTVPVKTSGIEDLTVIAAPMGWFAEINSSGQIEITAPNEADLEPEYDDDWNEIAPASAHESGYIKVHACGADGKCMVGRLPVEITVNPYSIAAYDGKIHVTCAASYTSYYYGVCKKEDYNAVISTVVKANNDMDFDTLDKFKYHGGSMSADVEETYGDVIEDGVEYIVWMYYEYASTAEDAVITYYSKVSIEATENTAERTSFNVSVNVSVRGVDSYVMAAIPESALLHSTLEEVKESMAAAASSGRTYGKMHTEDYSGSVYAVAEGTEISANGQESPNSKVYLLILPIDGRSEYTVDAVREFEFTTSPLTAGGTVAASASQAWIYTREEWNMELQQLVNIEQPLDAQEAPAVRLEAPAGECDYLYFGWFSDEDYAAMASDQDIVNALCAGWSNPVNSEPIYLPNFEMGYDAPNFVAFYASKDGKYGELAKVKCEVVGPAGKQLNFTWADMNDMPSALDFGVYAENMLCVGVSMVAQGAPADEYAGVYQMVNAPLNIEGIWPTSKTSGRFEVYSYNMFEEKQISSGTYSNWNGTTCDVTFDLLYLENVTMTISDTPITFLAGGGLM